MLSADQRAEFDELGIVKVRGLSSTEAALLHGRRDWSCSPATRGCVS